MIDFILSFLDLLLSVVRSSDNLLLFFPLSCFTIFAVVHLLRKLV